jgi:ribonuclease P/MRP protein subunit POP1
MPIWSALVFSSVRVGGLKEWRQQTFEAGHPAFPYDWPITQPFSTLVDQRAQELESRWKRTPPGKRIAFEALGSPSPFKADVILVLQDTVRCLGKTFGSAWTNEQKFEPWLLRGPRATAIVNNLVAVSGKDGIPNDSTPRDFNIRLRSMLQEHVMRRIDPTLFANALESNVVDGFVRVKVTPCGRGLLQECSALFLPLHKRPPLAEEVPETPATVRLSLASYSGSVGLL